MRGKTIAIYYTKAQMSSKSNGSKSEIMKEEIGKMKVYYQRVHQSMKENDE